MAGRRQKQGEDGAGEEEEERKRGKERRRRAGEKERGIPDKASSQHALSINCEAGSHHTENPWDA
jgi:hypothetical protein